MSKAFAGLSVVVTGASAGLGRQYALDFAAHGACVTVHGRSDGTLDVVEAIRKAGGQAVVAQGDVEDGEMIFATAIAAFGKVDTFVHNAGLVRDKSFARMSADDWSEVIRVHLGGAFASLKHIFPHMLERRFGRIVLTTSGAGFHGRFGQANYSVAKAGIIGLTKALAQEGARKNVYVNALAPWAITAMTEGVLIGPFADALRADRVSPFVLALSHPEMRENGGIFEAGGGWSAKYRWERSEGLHLNDADLTPQAILEHWAQLTSFEKGATHPITTDDTLPYFEPE